MGFGWSVRMAVNDHRVVILASQLRRRRLMKHGLDVSLVDRELAHVCPWYVVYAA